MKDALRQGLSLRLQKNLTEHECLIFYIKIRILYYLKVYISWWFIEIKLLIRTELTTVILKGTKIEAPT